MGDACCGDEAPVGVMSPDLSGEGEPEAQSFWRLGEVRCSIVSGVLLLAGLLTGEVLPRLFSPEQFIRRTKRSSHSISLGLSPSTIHRRPTSPASSSSSTRRASK